MKEKIKSQLRGYLNVQLRLCKAYMQDEDRDMAEMVWQQAIGAAIFTSISALGVYYDEDFSTEIDAMWENDYQEAFNCTLFPEVGV
nr:MAG TPA: hypothetical protein [Caudoviricetes sp.]